MCVWYVCACFRSEHPVRFVEYVRRNAVSATVIIVVVVAAVFVVDYSNPYIRSYVTDCGQLSCISLQAVRRDVVDRAIRVHVTCSRLAERAEPAPQRKHCLVQPAETPMFVVQFNDTADFVHLHRPANK